MKLTKSDFDLTTLEDELRVDGLCRELLMAFYFEKTAAGMSEHDATLLANSADYFVRDYLIGARQLNLLEIEGKEVRRFAGNWYIINTLDPAIDELEGHLKGVCEFFRYLAEKDAISYETFAGIESNCATLAFYCNRIESFWDIQGDGYYAWEAGCSLKND
jgi:hypothetical protein